MEPETSACPETPEPVCLGPGDPRREEAERLARHTYRIAYGASLAELPPYLLVFGGPGDGIGATLGFRAAAEGDLFLEQYLDRPVEAILSRFSRSPVPRREIVEIGGLASVDKGGATRVILPTARFLYAVGFRYAVFTATSRLRNSFRRLHLDLWSLGEARRGRLDRNDCADWGTYYDHDPRVCGGRLDQVRRVRVAGPRSRLRALCAGIA